MKVKTIDTNYIKTIGCVLRKISFNRNKILIACFPKSGSTFLARLIANLPNMQQLSITTGYGWREQELSLEKLILYNNKNYVAQHHVRFSDTTEQILDAFMIKPVVLVRNIFDIIVSLQDWYNQGNISGPMGFVPYDYSSWNNDKKLHFIVDMILPWYFNFYCTWNFKEKKILVTYEELVKNPRLVLEKILEFTYIKYKNSNVDLAVQKALVDVTRKNVGIVGRGEMLPEEIKDKVHKMARYYDDIDFSSIGLYTKS